MDGPFVILYFRAFVSTDTCFVLKGLISVAQNIELLSPELYDEMDK